MTCPGCGVAAKVRVYPYHCFCGEVHAGPSASPASRTFGAILREMVGCGCPIGWRKWDRRGLDWCREHASEIAARIAKEPNTGLDSKRAAELVRLAIEIASRQAGDGQQVSQAEPSE